jgi:HEAT repeat protein
LAVDDILQKLIGGDRRSIGRVEEVVAEVLESPELFDSLFAGLFSDDPLIRMRTADAVEKITAKQPAYLQPYKTVLIERAAKIDQQEVRWHMAQMFSRLEVDQSEQAAMIDILRSYLADNSKIVKTCAMQALAHFAERDASLRPEIILLLEDLTATGSPAMKSRGQKLLARLRQQSGLS